jgi:hypothetical protein
MLSPALGFFHFYILQHQRFLQDARDAEPEIVWIGDSLIQVRYMKTVPQVQKFSHEKLIDGTDIAGTMYIIKLHKTGQKKLLLAFVQLYIDNKVSKWQVGNYWISVPMPR